MNEEWRDIKGYENLYQVSNFGRIKSLDRYKITKGRYGKLKIKIKGKVLKPCLNHDGYYEVVLSKDGKAKMFRLHRIVANTFIENKRVANQVNHINGNKLDNRVDNLEWCTCKENIRHAVNNNLIKPVKGKNHYLAKKIGKFDKNNNLINIYETITEAGKQNKILNTSIVNCLKGRSKTSGGYIWKYL